MTACFSISFRTGRSRRRPARFQVPLLARFLAIALTALALAAGPAAAQFTGAGKSQGGSQASRRSATSPTMSPTRFPG